MDPYTRVPRSLKKKWKARETALMIAAWLTLIVVFLYGIGFLSGQFSPDIDWP